MALVLFEKIEAQFGLITLNDPDNLNAMSEAMAVEFAALTRKLSAEAQHLRAIILTGAGRAFSAGGHLEMLEKKCAIAPPENKRLMLEFYEAFLGILKLNIPIIAAINGPAIGAGLCVASACDIRIASDKAKLGFTFTRLGLHPGMGATYFLPRVIGYGAASELLLTARVVEANEALRLGLVSKVMPVDQVLAESVKIAKEISACGPQSVKQLLESLRSGPRNLSASLEREADCQSVNYAGAEFKEGVTAMREKRAAKF